MDTNKAKLLFTDSQYDIFTDLDVNGLEHAKNFIEIGFGAVQDFITTNGLTKAEAQPRIEALDKCIADFRQQLLNNIK